MNRETHAVYVISVAAELADAGVSLEGIRQVLELEAEVMQLREQVQLLESELRKASSGRRYEIVPLRQSVTVFGRRPSIFGGDDR